jgi:hypothetical protein
MMSLSTRLARALLCCARALFRIGSRVSLSRRTTSTATSSPYRLRLVHGGARLRPVASEGTTDTMPSPTLEGRVKTKVLGPLVEEQVKSRDDLTWKGLEMRLGIRDLRRKLGLSICHTYDRKTGKHYTWRNLTIDENLAVDLIDLTGLDPEKVELR